MTDYLSLTQQPAQYQQNSESNQSFFAIYKHYHCHRLLNSLCIRTIHNKQLLYIAN